MKTLLFAAAIAALAVPAGAEDVGIPNFHEVSPGVYRGGQPTEEGWKFLKAKGVKTVVKLNFASEASDEAAKLLGMNVVDASGPPSDLGNMLGAPEPDRIRLAVQTLLDPKQRPVFVHCLKGQDRTGLVVGLFRVLHQGYTKQAAWVEMKKLGFHRSLRGLRDFWKEFDGRTLAAGAKVDAALTPALTYRAGLSRVRDFVESRSDLFPKEKLEKGRLLGRDAKRDILGAWKATLDYVLALDSLSRSYGRFWTLERADRDKALVVSYAAFAAQYRFALEFIDRVENDPGLHPLLDEAVPDLGLPKGAYTRFKFRFLNVGRAAEFAGLEAVYKTVERKDPAADAAIKEDAGRLWAMGKGRGETLTARNGLKLVQQAGFTAWFPVQAGVAEWMGDTKVLYKNQALIKPAQIEALRAKLEPGDIILERREWYLSNIGLPGYWPHAALYAGDGQVIEAVSEGVVINTLEHSTLADAVAVLRPRLPKERRAEAITRAKALLGRPYDFDFDFRTDSALVCTELVWKSYEPQLRLPVEEILGRLAIPANLFARQFDAEVGTKEQQFDLVAFLDGAKEGSLEDFRKSWQRPKWHIVAQEFAGK